MQRKPHSLVVIFFYSLAFLFLFELISDFIESIYTFGLLNTNIPPEVVSILLFFTPFLLALFPRKVPRLALPILAIAMAFCRAAEVSLLQGPKMIAGGLGVGLGFLLLPVLASQAITTPSDGKRNTEGAAVSVSAGLTAALVFSIVLRTVASGSDFSSLHPWLTWLLAAGLIALSVLLLPLPREEEPATRPAKNTYGTIFSLALGLFSVILVLYFGFTSPNVLARWSEIGYGWVLGILALGLALYLMALAYGRLEKVTQPLVLVWNGAFILAGTASILLLQVDFPSQSSAYPFVQHPAGLVATLLLLVATLLSPVLLLDFSLFSRELSIRQPSPRLLGSSFGLAALFFLIFILAQVFTAVYDYIPVVGSWFRDRFWLAFLLPGLGIVLPFRVLTVGVASVQLPAIRKQLMPALGFLLVAAFAWALLSAPRPSQAAPTGTLRILTYNIQQGYSADGVRNYAGQLAVARDLAPDVIGLENPTRLVSQAATLIWYALLPMA